MHYNYLKKTNVSKNPKNFLKKSQEPDPRPNFDKTPPIKVYKNQNKNRGQKKKATNQNQVRGFDWLATKKVSWIFANVNLILDFNIEIWILILSDFLSRSLKN